MKIKCVELSQFESDLILAFSRQPKAAPVSTGLCRAIYRRLECQPAFARNNVTVYSKQSGPVIRPAIAEK